jgi:hypothetical protein
MNNNLATILVTISVAIILGLSIRGIFLATPSEVPKESEFKVVSTYKGCEYVRFSSRLEARSHYFLYCDK